MKHITPTSFGNKLQPTVNWTNKLNPISSGSSKLPVFSGSSKLPVFKLPVMRPNGQRFYASIK